MRIFDNLRSFALKLGVKMNNADYARTAFLTEDIKQLEALIKENAVAKKICIKRPRDMVRKWREVYSNELTAEKIEEFNKLESRLHLRQTLYQTLVWASLYGGVGLLIVTNRADLSKPLQPNEELRRLLILPKWKISPSGTPDMDVLSTNFGKYSQYSISSTNGMVNIHHSRLIIVNANAPVLSDETDIWGDSDLEAVIEVLKRFDAASANTGDLIFESKVDVFKINGLSDKISAGFENEVANVIANVQAIKSATNSLLLDTENEYEQKELSFAGLRDLIVEFRSAVAGAADMPLTILFGQSAAGFASGAEDIQNYHESINGLQEERLRPVFERLDPLLCNMLFGKQPDDWWFEFMPLREVTQEQQINMLNTFATATNVLIQNGVVSEIQVANELKESGLFANISAEDISALEGQADVDEFTSDDEEPASGNKKAEDDEVQADQGEQTN